jgi:hypothetical protein
MKLTTPGGRLEAVGFLKGESGFFIGVNAILRYRAELGLDRNHVLVLLSLLSHVRPDATDFSEASYAIIQSDTGLHRQVVLRSVKEMLAPAGAPVQVRTRTHGTAGKSRTVDALSKGLGVLARAKSVRLQKARGRAPTHIYRNGGPKQDTNVYDLRPLADRLLAMMRPAPDAREAVRGRGGFGKPVFEFDQTGALKEAPPASATGLMQVRVPVTGPTENSPSPKTRFGIPRFEFDNGH